MPVVIVTTEPNGDLHTFGRPEHTKAVIEDGLRGKSWAHFDVPEPAGEQAEVVTLRRLPPHPLAA